MITGAGCQDFIQAITGVIYSLHSLYYVLLITLCNGFKISEYEAYWQTCFC